MNTYTATTKEYTSPAFVIPPQVCQIKNTEQCMFETTGRVICNGPVTSGASDKQSTDKMTASTNERMFNLMVDTKIREIKNYSP